ncbi:MAG TPA: cation:proton antiporter, partial [Gemmatimonadaceae bacterium]|nr:cation:proton antiporter [Gemmatimonadaceae bacterium]
LVQVAGTIAVFALLGRAIGTPLPQAVFAAALVAFSSTAIILKVYADRGELEAPFARVVVAILLFQDLCVVPLMLFLPLLGGEGADVANIGRSVGVAIVVTTLLLVVGRWAVPRALARIAEMRNQEIFTLVVVAIGLGAAFVTSSFGLSLALGSFLAGLIIAESEYGLQALSDVLPFRDTFSGIFFISVGMLLDVRYVAANAILVLGVAAGIVLLKTLIGWLVVRIVRRSSRVGLVAGIGLAQVGEFSFILASSAVALGIMGEAHYQLFLGASVITMLVAPFAVSAAPDIADRVFTLRALPTMEFATREVRAAAPLTDHVIIVGYGLNGKNLARALRRARIPYVILDSNGALVRQARLAREPIFFGDGTRAEVLDRVGLKRARVIVFAIASVGDERRGVVVARHHNPGIHIVTRTRSVSEIPELQRLGANEVVPEEFETSLEIFARVLRRFGVSPARIREVAEETRQRHYEALRERGAHVAPVDEVLSREGARLGLEVVVARHGAEAIGHTVRDLKLRTRTGAIAAAVLRHGEGVFQPTREIVFEDGDEVVLVGDPRALAEATPLFRPMTRVFTAVHAIPGMPSAPLPSPGGPVPPAPPRAAAEGATAVPPAPLPRPDA